MFLSIDQGSALSSKETKEEFSHLTQKELGNIFPFGNLAVTGSPSVYVNLATTVSFELILLFVKNCLQ